MHFIRDHIILELYEAFYKKCSTSKFIREMAVSNKDIKIPDIPARKSLLLDLHAKSLAAYGKDKNDFDYVMSEYFHMSGVYWVLTALKLIGREDMLDKNEMVEIVLSCQHANGGFGGNAQNDPHLLYTLSAIQVLAIYESLDRIDPDRIAEYIVGQQQADGSFFGDKWGEVDTRFSFCALASLLLINRLDRVDVDRAVEFVVSCMNFDGGFGCVPGSESHSGQIYCCIGALAITNRLYKVKADVLGAWLCERQLKSGGLNGRPEKLPDVCYSWWVLASLRIIGRINWIDADKMKEFILACQDEESGGIADRPGDITDPFHTLFGLTGLSLLGHYKDDIKPVNPVLCMPEETLEKLGIKIYLLR